MEEIDEFCKEYNIPYKTKIKFRTFMQKLHGKQDDEKKIQINDIDEELRNFLSKSKIDLNVYDVLIKQNIGFKQVSTITQYDIDRLCDKNNIKIGTKIDFKNAVDKYQINKIRQSK